MSAYPTFPTVEVKQTTMRELVQAIDPQWKEPIVTYEFPNGRDFTEPQDQPYR